MKRIVSKIQTDDAVYQENQEHNRAHAEALAQRLAVIRAGGSERARERPPESGQG